MTVYLDDGEGVETKTRAAVTKSVNAGGPSQKMKAVSKVNWDGFSVPGYWQENIEIHLTEGSINFISLLV
jgi:hypothetical protein